MAPVLPAEAIKRCTSAPLLPILARCSLERDAPLTPEHLPHREAHLEDVNSAPEAVEAWLDELRLGWGQRFSPAFKSADVDLSQLPELSSEQLRELEQKLEAECGAKVVQIKQIRKAIEAFALQRREGPQSSPVMCNIYKQYQSPMAAYFGDDSFSTGYFGEQSVRSSRTPLSSKSPFGRCSATGLPCKSPMSAYFDGDCDAFTLATSPEGNAVPSPASMTNSAMSSDSPPTVSPEASFNFSQMVHWQPPSLAAQTPKSALRQESSRSGMRVRWADDGDHEQKACIRLTELLDISNGTSPLPEASSAPSALEVRGRVWELSRDAKGCRDVQEAIQRSPLPQACALVAELQGHVCSAVQCPHANHVLRKIIMTMPAPAFNFILEELRSQGASHVAETARHRFGCRIVEGLLSKGAPSQVLLISECLLQDTVSLCNHMYANFVMQRMFEYAPAPHRSLMMQVLRTNLPSVGANFFGSAVLGKALQYGGDGERHALAADVASVPGLLAAIAKYKHGKSIVTAVLDTLNGVEREVAVKQLQAPPLKAPKVSRGS